MSTSTRVGGFALGLVGLTAAAAALGAAVGPVDVEPAQHQSDHESGHESGHGTGSPETSEHTPGLPGGLMVSQDGYSLQLLDDSLATPGPSVLRFRITDASGAVVTAYQESHGKDLHLIAVRRDLGDFQHLHPELGADGTWSIPLTLDEPGEYRVFADFKPADADAGLTLGHDLSVAGRYRPRPLPAPARVARVDGYQVRLDGELVAGETSRLRLVVTRDGRPVTDLQPYLGAYGHLVAVRDHDLAYLHVHPDGPPAEGGNGAGPGIAFDAEVPSTGDFRLFLDFRHAGRVHTAAFTATAADADTGADTDAGDTAHDGSDHH